jgi:hypothetical protein
VQKSTPKNTVKLETAAQGTLQVSGKKHKIEINRRKD